VCSRASPTVNGAADAAAAAPPFPPRSPCSCRPSSFPSCSGRWWSCRPSTTGGRIWCQSACPTSTDTCTPVRLSSPPSWVEDSALASSSSRAGDLDHHGHRHGIRRGRGALSSLAWMASAGCSQRRRRSSPLWRRGRPLPRYGSRQAPCGARGPSASANAEWRAGVGRRDQEVCTRGAIAHAAAVTGGCGGSTWQGCWRRSLRHSRGHPAPCRGRGRAPPSPPPPLPPPPPPRPQRPLAAVAGAEAKAPQHHCDATEFSFKH